MMENSLFFIHGTILLLFGTFLSGAFSGIKFKNFENIWNFLLIGAACGVLQLTTYLLFQEEAVKELYPFNTHLPLIVFLCLKYKKRPATSLVSVFTAYLFCQPANWFGILALHLTHSAVFEYAARCVSLLIVGFFTLRYLSPYFARIYEKDSRSVYVFGIMPIVYYVFDYATMIYTDLWLNNNRIVAEFLPLFCGVIYMIFAILYCSENEEKVIAQHKAELLRITAEQQTKKIEAIKRNEKEIRILHHDMRLFLNSLSVCLEENDLEKAKKMLSAYASSIENTRIQRFCNVDNINYVLSDFSAKCRAKHITFLPKVEVEEFLTDANLFALVLSNSLDNALNAQMELPESSRKVNMTLKTSRGKLLLSVENPVLHSPLFEHGMPVTTREGHGYGTQSIAYTTERLGGKCQFTVQDHIFTTRIII